MKHNSSVIRQKGESWNGSNKKTKHTEFCEKRLFLTFWYVKKYLVVKGVIYKKKNSIAWYECLTIVTGVISNDWLIKLAEQ